MYVRTRIEYVCSRLLGPFVFLRELQVYLSTWHSTTSDTRYQEEEWQLFLQHLQSRETDGSVGGRMDGLVGGRMDGLVGGRMDGLVGGRMDGLVGGWMGWWEGGWVGRWERAWIGRWEGGWL